MTEASASRTGQHAFDRGEGVIAPQVLWAMPWSNNQLWCRRHAERERNLGQAVLAGK